MNLNEECLITFLNNPKRLENNLDILNKYLPKNKTPNIINKQENFNNNIVKDAG